MKTLIIGFLVSLALSNVVTAQVDEIKRESARHSENRSRPSLSSSSSSTDYSGSPGESLMADVVVNCVAFTFGGIGMWQKHRLAQKADIPTVVSLDVMLQTAIQPATYYIVQPRVRANWGIFSSDFRFNYLVEEGIEGTKHIRTDDWQILQLNIFNTRNFTGRFGGGILHENFSGGKTFAEWTAGIHLQDNDQKLGGILEYRWSEPRLEANAQFHYNIFNAKSLHTYLTGGVVFQQYYDKINVWGMQVGVMFRIF